MLRLAPIRAFAGAVVLGTLSFGGCACEETPSNIVGLAFVAPNPGARIQLSDDTDPNTSNVQVTIKLRAVGLNAADADGKVTLTNKSDVDSAAVEVPLQGNGTTKVAVFDAFTLVSGANELEAVLSHSFGASVTTTANFSVVAPGGPSCRFAQAPNGPALSAGVTLSDDLDVINAGFQTHIGVNCDGEGVVDGLTVGLNVQGAAAALSGTLSGGSVVFNNVSLPEGSARLTTYVLINQDQAGTASLDLNVDTGRCDVSVTSPANGTPILAANDADPSTPDVADVDVVVTSTRCGSGSTVTIPVGADPVTGTIGDDGSATLRIVLPQSANNNDLQNFTAVVSDQSASRNQGSSLRQVHLVDTVAPGLEVVGIAADGTTVLTAADDQDANPLDDLTYRLQVRATNYADVDLVFARVGDDEAGAVSAAPSELGVATLDVRLPAGAQTLTVYATDAAGNQTSVVRQVEVDITVPVVTLVQPAQSGAVLANADADPDTEGFQLDCYVSIANFSTISGLDPRVFCELQTLDDQGNATGPWVASALAVPAAQDGDVGVGGVRLTLPDGQWGIRAGAVTRGGSGNSAQPSAPLNLNVDGTAPTITFANPSNGAVISAGNSSIELAISDAEEGQAVSISVNGGPALDPAPTVDANGRALVENVIWADRDGDYTLTADVSDQAGNPAAQASISVTVDGTSPGVTLFGLDGSAEGSVRDIVADGALNATQNLALDWGADVGNGFQYGFRVVVVNEPVGQAVTLRLNGGLINGATVDSNGATVANFSNNNLGFTLLEGDNGISATVTDRAGNTTTVNAVVTVTTGQPFVRILSPADGSQTNSNQVAVTASSNAADGAACSLVARLGGQADVTASANAGGDGAIDFGALELAAEGAWVLTATCPFDGRDPVNSASATVTIDQTAPVLTFTGLPQVGGENVFTAADAPDSTQGNRYRRDIVVSAAANGACTVAGVNPAASLSVTGGGVDVANVARSSFTAGNDCSFTFSNVALADEVNDPNSSVTLAVASSDVAGNAGSANAAILVDRVGPTLTVTDPVNNAQLGTEDDSNQFLPGLQYDVEVSSTGAADGSQISLLVDDQVVSSTAAAQGVTFVGVSLADGQRRLSATAVDTVGNTGASATNNVEVDATAPTIDIFNPGAGQLFGINEDTNGQLAGFQVVVRMGVQGVDLGTVVQILDSNDQVLGSGQLAAATLEIPNIEVPEGTHTLTARVDDGINSATDTVTVTVDLTRPTISDCTWVGDDGAQQAGLLVFNKSEDADANAAGWQGSCTATVAGQAENATVTMLTNNPAPDTASGTGGITDGTATVAGSLGDGDHTVTLSVVDAAGNTNEPGAGMVVRVDVTPPTSTITSPANGSSLLAAADSDPQNDGMQTTISVSTDAEEGTTVSIRNGDAELATATVANGAASAAVTLPEGAVSLTAVATDEAGNATTSSAVAVTVDSIAPVIAVTSPAANAAFGDDNDADEGLIGFQTEITVTTGQVENGQQVTVRSTVGGERCSETTSGAPLTMRCTLLEGEQTLTAVVSDTSGNETTSTGVPITLSLVAPTLLFTTPDSNPANLNAADDADNGTPDLQYSFVLSSDAVGQTVTLSEGGNDLGTGIVANGAATIGPLTLTEGTHNLRATVTQDGNTTNADLTVVVDVTAPTITMTSPAASPAIYTVADDQQGGAPLNTSFAFNISGAIGGTLSGVSDQTATIGTVAINADGAATITGATLNSGLVHEITFTVTDAAGNTAEALLSATVDVVAPNAMSISGAVQDKRTGTVRLTWNEPGDDADTGTITGYQVRHSGNTITAGNFESATQASEAMVPQAAGAAFEVDIAGVSFDDPSVSIAARAVDDVGNLGAIENSSIISVNTELTEAEFQPAGTSAKWGWDICSGDFNNDGFDDVVVTDRDYVSNGVTVGAVFIYYGQANAANLTPTLLTGTVSGGRFGNFCTTADFNEDNFDELIVSTVSNTDGGKAYIFNGSAQGVALTPTTTVQGAVGATGYFGYSVSAQGSVLGDGTVDLAVSAPLLDGQTGTTYFFDGDDIAAGGTVAQADAVASFVGGAGSRAGLVVISGHDFVGDAAGDVVLGAPYLNSRAGGVYVITGNEGGGLSGAYTTASNNVVTIAGAQQTTGQMGFRVAVGNVVGTNKKDLIVNHGTTQGTYWWYIYEGANTLSTDATVTLPIPGTTPRFKYANQQSSCDINGDGYDDLILGAETRAYVYFGHQNGADFNLSSDREYDLGSGWGLGVCADANGDSAIDLAVVRTVSGGSWRLRY